MPSSLTYPGVYVEEVPSGVRTITGVATSVTAFIGRARKGPIDTAIDITSFADFERKFGGLWLDSPMSFAVRDFFLNGGARAVIVRLFHSLAPDAVKKIADAAATGATGKEAKDNAKKVLDAFTATGSESEKSAANAANVPIAALADAADRATIDTAVNAARATIANLPSDDRRAINVVDPSDPARDVANKIATEAEKGANGKEAKDKAKAALDAITAHGSEPEKSAAKAANAPIAALADDADKAAVANAVKAARATIEPAPPRATSLKFRAASPGRWAGYLRVQVEAASGPGLADIEKDLNVQVGANQLFKLTVTDLGPGGITETHLNVTLVKSCVRRVDKVLTAASTLIAWGDVKLDDITPALPDLTKVKGDVLATAYAALLAAMKANPDPNVDPVKTAKKDVDTALAAALASVDDGGLLKRDDFVQPNGETNKKGLHSLEQLYTRDGIFNLLCIPPYTATHDGDVEPSVVGVAGAYCEKRRAMLLVDAPSGWNSVDSATKGFSAADPDLIGYRGRNAALFFPRLSMPNPLQDNQLEKFSATGAVAGIFARTDTQRGVWKSPAGLDASFIGVSSFTTPLTDDENGLLNPLGVNCLRNFPVYGNVLWGARTLRGADAFADEYKYTAVRRTALYIEESLYRALKWVVFEPNDEPLWAQIRLNVGAFMHNLFHQHAFQGQTKNEAYFVQCDATTTTQNDINLGIVNINVGFAPLKPAEFVVIKLQQMAGAIET
jgi:phage tail sheath protein FI